MQRLTAGQAPSPGSGHGCRLLPKSASTPDPADVPLVGGVTFPSSPASSPARSGPRPDGYDLSPIGRLVSCRAFPLRHSCDCPRDAPCKFALRSVRKNETRRKNRTRTSEATNFPHVAASKLPTDAMSVCGRRPLLRLSTTPAVSPGCVKAPRKSPPGGFSFRSSSPRLPSGSITVDPRHCILMTDRPWRAPPGMHIGGAHIRGCASGDQIRRPRQANRVVADKHRGALPANPAPVGSRTPSAPAAAATSGSTRCGRRSAGRTKCHGRRPS